MGTLIVGASVAGVRTAQALRGRGYTDSITMLGEERHFPYDKPPISKEMLGDGAGTPVPLLTAEQLVELDVDLRLGVRAESLDLVNRSVTASDGQTYRFDDLVIATGVSPRTLPGSEGLQGVHTLRTADDADAVRSQLMTASDVVVIGAGFIGAEFAAAARSHGVRVDVVEPQVIPMSHVLGEEVGAELSRLHTLNGVTMHTGVGVAALVGGSRVDGVTLTDGRTLRADLVVVGIGATPATGWLESSGLPLDNGVVCDERLRAVGAERVYAAGDVARWPSPHADGLVRIEHWTNANEHGGVVAASIMGADAPAPPPPYVWSDQYGQRIQIVGRPAAGELGRAVGAVDSPPFAAIYTSHEGRVVGALVVDDPRLFMKCRKAITTGSMVGDLDMVLGLDPAT
ncbi:NAD(P)/FAD-dependent oxidoreductase [Gordonia polyisoprenivorans]|uniref:NAD(P)/FAD-dependent oxidoreductase n=1 Tax=Gordonia polyisoprenivorans TaxID=84595 RepID=UPI001AD6AC0F|nr:FAD-dependent oxidoreductase [Gordonia polyisoprenivorans]QTI69915.1 FAD-dependent oxidoreductase [Gordonia polyisoprenivorans]